MLIDPDLVGLADEMEVHNRRTRAFLAKTIDFDTDTPEGIAKMRAFMEPGGFWGSPPVEEATERTIPGPVVDVPIRVFVPGTVSAVYLSIHGGGWALGNRAMSDGWNWRIAQECDAAVVSVEYRLAPEHPYPAPNDDCEAAAVWLLEHAAAEFGTDRLLIGGGSAGAHLAATTLLRMRDRHGAADRFHAANLEFGVFDLTGTPSQFVPTEPGAVLRSDGLRPMVARYAPGRSFQELRDPDLSPLYGDLSGLCPALFTVGTDDPLLDDSVFMAARWELAGNHSELAVYPRGPHGVTGAPTEIGRRASSRIVAFLGAAARGALAEVS
jgi:acetyl esterase/lipase